MSKEQFSKWNMMDQSSPPIFAPMYLLIK